MYNWHVSKNNFQQIRGNFLNHMPSYALSSCINLALGLELAFLNLLVFFIIYIIDNIIFFWASFVVLIIPGYLNTVFQTSTFV